MAYVAFFQKKLDDNAVYTDLTGIFLITSLEVNKYIFVLYQYDSNTILAKLMKNRTDDEALEQYEDCYTYLEDKSFKVTLNIMEDEASKAVQRQIVKSGARFQLVEPNNHCVNDAERAIQMFRHHFIAELSPTDPKFPISLWGTLIPQAVIALNLLRTSRLNPQLSVCA